MKLNLFFTVVLSVYLGASLTTNLQAQTKRTQPTSKPVTTQTATTDDGRKVTLKSNKTWEYAAEDSTVTETQGATQPKVKPNSVLSIETGLVFKSGDVKPLARTEFHILDESLANILRNAGLKPPKSYGETGEADRDYVSAFAFASKYNSNPTYQEFYPRAIEALKPHIVQSVTTDFSGKAKFAPVAAGTYYIMGLGSTPRGFVIWNLKIDLKAGENPVVLDQNNADIAL
jgi:hypothetical protein